MDTDRNPVQFKKAKKCFPSTTAGRRISFKNVSNSANGTGTMDTDDIQKQIFRSQLPPYAPPTLQSSDNNASRFFTCTDCGDRFLLESSLTQHFSRRSVKITMSQPGEAKQKLFYNRCTLLAFLRENLIPGSAVQILLKPLERDQILLPLPVSNSTPEPMDIEVPNTAPVIEQTTTKFKPSSVEETAGNNCSSLANQDQTLRTAPSSSAQSRNVSMLTKVIPNEQTTTLLAHDKESTVIQASSETTKETDHNVSPQSTTTYVKGSSKFKYLNLGKCPECCFKLPPNIPLHQHFSEKKTNPENDLRCVACNLPFANPCSLKCHEKIHSLQFKSKGRFICPDCGIEFLSWDTFINHLQTECMHAYLGLGVQCQICSVLFPTTVSLQVHFSQIHVKTVRKCLYCNIAYFSLETLQKHCVDAHQKSTEGKPVIYRLCELCPGRLITENHLMLHIHKHAEDPTNSVVRYVCEPCKVFLECGDDFRTHKQYCKLVTTNLLKSQLKTTEKKKKTEQLVTKKILFKIPVANLKRLEKTDKKLEKTDKKLEKNDISRSPPMEEHQKMEESQDIKLPLNECPQIEESEIKTQDISPPSKFINNNNRPCHKCGRSMQPYKKSFACIKCNKNLSRTFKKMALAKVNLNGTAKVHRNISNCKVGRKSNVPTVECPVCKVSLTDSFDSVQYHFSNEHNGLRFSPKSYHNTLLELKKTEDKREILGRFQYKCCMCELSTDDEEMFREHVITHQPEEGSTYQCLECGTCYVVKPSLEKHLLLSHRIRGVDAYLRESGQEHLENRIQEVHPIKENQCEVCFAEFEEQSELNSHLRAHGLAFLRNIS